MYSTSLVAICAVRKMTREFSSVVQSCLSLCDPMACSMPGFPVHHQFWEFTHAYSNSCPLSHWCHPTISSSVVPFSSCLQPFPASGSFLGQLIFIRWPKYCSFSFSISPYNEYWGLISFSIDWFDLLTIQGTLKSLLQHHSSKASILQCSAFFMAQLSHPHVAIGKTIALTKPCH